MQHTIFNKPIDYSSSESSGAIILGAGCFWGVERKFWSLPGVQMTSVGYAGGHAANPTYESVCSGSTGHSEVVKIQFDSSILSLKELLKIFWECHDPTQGNRQGNDIGTQYRSVIFHLNETQKGTAQRVRRFSTISAGLTEPYNFPSSPAFAEIVQTISVIADSLA